MFRGLEHTAIASPDPHNLAQWYVDHLDFIVKAANGAMLEIIPSAGDRPAQTMKDPGLRHLAILVGDFDAAHDRLRKAGVRFLTEPVNVKGNRLVFFADCDGNLLHLVQREKPLP